MKSTIIKIYSESCAAKAAIIKIIQESHDDTFLVQPSTSTLGSIWSHKYVIMDNSLTVNSPRDAKEIPIYIGEGIAPKGAIIFNKSIAADKELLKRAFDKVRNI